MKMDVRGEVEESRWGGGEGDGSWVGVGMRMMWCMGGGNSGVRVRGWRVIVGGGFWVTGGRGHAGYRAVTGVQT